LSISTKSDKDACGFQQIDAGGKVRDISAASLNDTGQRLDATRLLY
jgi:hypothetical protein